ncbi:MAG: hypothetical protein IT198_02015 [Acidimicrobiia bacterium]|nr:hypothetical protein [Acidimicrobiia bacterium]
MLTALRILSLLLVLATGTAACGEAKSNSATTGGWDAPVVVGEDEIVPQIVSGDLVAGEPTRLLFGLLDVSGKPLAEPDLPVHVRLYDIEESGEEPAREADAHFFWAIPGSRAMYEVDEITFARPGVWGAEVEAGDETVRVKFDVKEQARGIAVGEPAPLAPTPTAAGAGGDLSAITTDAAPDPDLYDLSVPDAVAAGKPFAVVLGTPEFCTSGTCGPLLDTVKTVKVDYPNMNFVHVEVFENLHSPEPTLSPVVEAWRLPSEPWVYVVGSDGKVFRRFEGAASEASLRNAFDHVT